RDKLVTGVQTCALPIFIALETSRLARHHRDWHHLIELCALPETVLMEGDGVYDPRPLHYRVVLGMQGAMAESALGVMRQRAREEIGRASCRERVESAVE